MVVKWLVEERLVMKDEKEAYLDGKLLGIHGHAED
jgi:phosphoribosylglycinamide formyltransferase-1